MKRIIKIITVLLASLFLFCGFVGCDQSNESKPGPIPDGYYMWTGEDDVFRYTENSIRGSYGWEIDGDKAQEWVSSKVYYKAKIVKKDSKIYFEGYKWRDFIDVLCGNWEKEGNTDVYEVIYDEVEKKIILTLIYRE